MRGLIQVINQLVAATGLQLAPWMAPAAVLALMVPLLPFILRNMKTGRARKLLKQAAMFSGEPGVALERQALALVTGYAPGLIAVAEEALRRGRTQLAWDALERLVDTGKERKAARRIYKQLEQSLPATVHEMALVIERLLDAGMVEEAARRLDRAEDKWPDEPTFEALRLRMTEVQGL